MNAEQIQSWSKVYLAEILNTTPEKIDPSLDMDSLGLDSTVAVAYIMSLEEQVGVELMPELLFDFPTVKGLSEHIVNELMPNAVEV